MDLPRIDTHAIEVDAPAAATWAALIANGESAGGRAERFARLLGCDPGGFAGEPGELGSTVPGFRVVRSQPPRRLTLEGRHRFSRYRLDFEVEEAGGERSMLRATTDAAFPGIAGQLYKTAVIRTRGHVLATRRVLQSVAQGAERARLGST